MSQTNPNRAISYYALQVLTGHEGRYISAAGWALECCTGKFIWPRRAMTIRKAGIWTEQIQALYPGYLFFETRSLSDETIMALRGAGGFVKFLKSNRDIRPLDARDRAALLDLVACGEIIQKSTVTFDENNRIRVIDGPLARLEGNIVRVDRRKGRARVALTLHGRTLTADLSFETIESVPEIKAVSGYTALSVV